MRDNLVVVILLKVALNTISQTEPFIHLLLYMILLFINLHNMKSKAEGIMIGSNYFKLVNEWVIIMNYTLTNLCQVNAR
jgi:hypothetical protein